MDKKIVYKSELVAYTDNGIGYITRQHLSEENDSLVLKETSKVVEGEELRYCNRCGCEWLNIIMEGENIFSTKKSEKENIHEPLEERKKHFGNCCVECGSEDSETIRKTSFLDKTNET